MYVYILYKHTCMYRWRHTHKFTPRNWAPRKAGLVSLESARQGGRLETQERPDPTKTSEFPFSGLPLIRQGPPQDRASCLYFKAAAWLQSRT